MILQIAALKDLTVSEWMNLVHGLAKSKGWHEGEETEAAFLMRTGMNIHAELSELWEAYRGGVLNQPCDKADKMKDLGLPRLTSIEEELADIFIRLCDSAARLNVDLSTAVCVKHLFNASRPHRHGGKLA